MLKQKPITLETPDSHHDTKTTHPAFGTIQVFRVSCNPSVGLFDSPLKHNHYINLRVSTASISRGLNRDWLSSDKTFLEFSMSENQWGHFVSSQGLGSGTPVTLNHVPSDLVGAPIPAIDSDITMKEQHLKDIDRACKDIQEAAKGTLKKLSVLIDKGRAGKIDLIQLQTEVNRFTENLPTKMEFVVSGLTEEMDKTINAGKSEIHAYINNTVSRLGIEAMTEQTKILTLKD